jgi:hypothetical protein
MCGGVVVCVDVCGGLGVVRGAWGGTGQRAERHSGIHGG